MPLTIPLADLRHQLQELLTDDLAGALKNLRDLLPERSEKQATVIGLLGRLSDANKARLRNTLSNEDLQREYDTLRANLLDLLTELTEADFDAAIATHAEVPGQVAAKHGSVLYRIPHQMPMLRETKCVVRIAVNEDAIVEDIQLDEHVTLKALRRVSELMQVELDDPSAEGVFHIRSTSEPQQLVLDDGYTEWFFYVEPLRAGTWPLEVKVAVIELALGKECKREFVLSETVQILTETPVAIQEAPLKSAGYVLPFQSPAPVKGKGAQSIGGLLQDKPHPPAPTMVDPMATGAVSPAPPSIPPPPTSMPPKPPPVIVPLIEAAPPARKQNRGLRTLAILLAFLVVGAGTTWAATPAATRDWWVTRYLENTPDAYADFVQEHPESQYRELAYYRKALLTALPADYLVYLDNFGTNGRYYQQTRQQLQTLEVRYFDQLRADPTIDNLRRYLLDFPASERLSEVKKLVDSHAELRAEGLSALETAYLAAVRQDPSVITIQHYLADFPQSRHLEEVQQAVSAHPELRQQVQSCLEDAYIKQVQANPTADQVRDYLQNISTPTQLPKLNQLLEKMPQLKRQVQPEIKQAEERRERLVPELLEGNKTQQPGG